MNPSPAPLDPRLELVNFFIWSLLLEALRQLLYGQMRPPAQKFSLPIFLIFCVLVQYFLIICVFESQFVMTQDPFSFHNFFIENI